MRRTPERALEFDLFRVFRIGQRCPSLQFCSQKREHGGVAAIVQDHVAGFMVTPVEDAVDIIPILTEAFAFDGEDGQARGRNRRRRMVLGRENVARCPA